MPTKVVNIHHKVPYDIYCGRSGKGQTSIWGNKFTHIPAGTRARTQIVWHNLTASRQEDLLNDPHISGYTVLVPDRAQAIRLHQRWIVRQNHLLIRLGELKDHTLGCFCHPQACHCDNLAYLADLWQATCPDCGAMAGGMRHVFGCDVERCTVCKGQRLSCQCTGRTRALHDLAAAAWNGFWPGYLDCWVRGWYCKRNPNGPGYLVCRSSDEGAGFDLNRWTEFEMTGVDPYGNA